MNPRNTQTRLEDILKALGNIYDVRRLLTKYPHEELLPEIVYNSTIYSLIIIGEAIKHIDPKYRNRYPHIKWKELISLRNELTHEYFAVNLDYLDTLIDEHLREFAQEIAKILEN